VKAWLFGPGAWWFSIRELFLHNSKHYKEESKGSAVQTGTLDGYHGGTRNQPHGFYVLGHSHFTVAAKARTLELLERKPK